MPERYAKQFDMEGVRFSMQDHLMMIDVENEFAQFRMTTHGASVLSYVPKQNNPKGLDVLWVSDCAIYDGSKPVRGGIPVCWPWFGQAKEVGLPAHGFVRNSVWHLDQVHHHDNGITELVLVLESDENTLKIWPHAFHVELKIEVGAKLSMALTTHNLNEHDIEITEALHTYFSVGNANGIMVEGLEGSDMFDKLRSDAPGVTQVETVKVLPPMDSVFIDQTKAMRIVDDEQARTIVIETSQAQSAIVWNPGAEGIQSFADMPNEAWPSMLCVEAGNVLQNAVMVPGGEKHRFSMALSLA